MPKLKPLGDHVIVKPSKPEEVTKSGIILSAGANDKPQVEGEVVSVGSGKLEKGERMPMDIKVGDRVIFEKYSGREMKIGDQDFSIITQDDILAVIE